MQFFHSEIFIFFWLIPAVVFLFWTSQKSWRKRMKLFGNIETLQNKLIPGFRGKEWKYIAHYPDGRSETLLHVPKYDYNWQESYILRERISIPKGTRLEGIAHFDNSENNFANPDPTIAVRFGEQTWDEMMIGYFDFVTH